MKKNICTILFTIITLSLAGQTIKLSAPPFAGKQVRLYYFEGAKTDSLLSVIDPQGNVKLVIPESEYRGMATLMVVGAGALEMIVAEPVVKVNCNNSQLNTETVSFIGSAENDFLKHIFLTQSQYMRQQVWLEGGMNLFPDNLSLKAQLNTEQSKLQKTMERGQQQIANSSLYAAQYYRLADFMNRLFSTEQRRDSKAALDIRHEMESTLDIASLYTSGQLWNSALNFYASLFNHTLNDSIKQEQYAASIQKTCERLPAPYFEAFIAGCITETERFGWRKAQEKIIGHLLSRYQGFSSTYPNLQRAIAAYRLGRNEQMPAIIGLKDTKNVYDKTLIAFHDSDCNTCVNEMYRLRVIYSQLEEKGIRVVSIAADTDRIRYEEATKDYPWVDKLCDFKGFEGANFSNYNVIGSPSFYMIDKNRKLLGVYFSMSDVENDL
ncbi:MAG: thioredoxin-like domain-containing protein [Dysgonomonas sp.]